MTSGPTDPDKTAAQIMDELFRTHRAELERKVARIVGSREIARDIVQDTFVDMQKNWPSEVRSSIAYLYSVAHARAVDTVRREATATDYRDRLDPPQDIPSPDLLLLQNNARQSFRDAIQQLTNTERELLNLRAEGLTFAQIGERFGKTADAVAQMVHRALKRCRKRLRDLEIDAADIGPSGFE